MAEELEGDPFKEFGGSIIESKDEKDPFAEFGGKELKKKVQSGTGGQPSSRGLDRNGRPIITEGNPLNSALIRPDQGFNLSQQANPELYQEVNQQQQTKAHTLKENKELDKLFPEFKPQLGKPVNTQSPDLRNIGGFTEDISANLSNTRSTSTSRALQSAIEAYEASQGEGVTEAIRQGLDLQQLGALESMGNSFKNMATRLKGTIPRLNIVSADIWENAVGKELTKKLYEFEGRDIDQVRKQAYEELKNLSSETKATLEISDAFKRGGLKNLSAGLVNGITSVGSTMLPAILTGGATTFTDMMGDALVDFNTEKAKRLGISVDELYKTNQADFNIPALAGALGGSLELIGLKGVNNLISKKLAGESFKKAALYFGAETQKEGLTEWLQTGLEEANKAKGQGKSWEEAGKIAVDSMFSKKGLESYLQGTFAAGAIGAGSHLTQMVTTPSAKTSLADDVKIINMMEMDLNNPDLTPQSQEAISKQINNSISNMAQTIEDDDQLVNSLDEKKKSQVEIIGQKIDQLDNVISDPAISEETKKAMEAQKKPLEKELEDVIKETPTEEITPEEGSYEVRDIPQIFKESANDYEAYNSMMNKLFNSPDLDNQRDIKLNELSEKYDIPTYDEVFNEVLEEENKGKGFFDKAKRFLKDPGIIEKKAIERYGNNLEQAVKDEAKQPITEEVPKTEETTTSTIQEIEDIPSVLFHGTPHKFEGFKSNKIGTGEGNQAFGAGLYFTNQKDIAENYANNISSKQKFWDYLQDGNDISLTNDEYTFINDELDALGFDGSRAEDAGLSEIIVDGKPKDGQSVYEALAVLFGKNAESNLKDYGLTEDQTHKMLEIKKKITDPQLYEISLKGASDKNFITWDGNLSDSQKKKIGDEYNTNQSGKDLYNDIVKDLGSQQKASDYLASKGIDGIVYKSNKGTGGKTGLGRNYVIFDENSIQINKINEKPVEQLKTKQDEKSNNETVREKSTGQKDGQENESKGRVEEGQTARQGTLKENEQQKVKENESETRKRSEVQSRGSIGQEIRGEEPSSSGIFGRSEEVRKEENGRISESRTEEVLIKAEDDLEALKQVKNKSAKYDASIKRLNTALKEGTIDQNQFNDTKARFDDVIGQTALKQTKGETSNAIKIGEQQQGNKPERKGADGQQQREQENREYQEEPIKETEGKTSSSNRVLESGTEQKIAKIKEDRDSIKARISEKLKAQRGKLSSGFDPSLVSDFIDLGKTYIDEGIVNAKEFIRRFREDYKDMGFEDKDITDEQIEKEIFNKTKETEGIASQEELNVLGITKDEVRNLREELGEEQYTYETKNRAKLVAEANKLRDSGFSVPKLIERIKEKPQATAAEVELLRQYYVSLTARIGNEKDAVKVEKLLKERKELLSALDVLKTESGRTVQAFDGLLQVEDNLATFLEQEGQYYDLPADEIKELTEKYNKAKEANEKLQAIIDKGTQEANEKAIKEQIRKSKANKTKASVKQDFKAERKQYIADFRAELKRIRTTPSAVILPYQRELIALAPFARKMVQSYVNEGIYDIKTIVEGIHSEFKDDIDGLTENDVRDILAGQYPNPRNTKNSKLAQVRDLETQARLERKIELLEQGILETNKPSVRRIKSEEIQALEEQIKEIKKRNPDLTAPSKLEARKTWLKNKIQGLKEELDKGQFDEIVEPPKVLLDAEALRLKDEYINFREETRLRRQQKEYDALNKLQKAGHILKQVQGLKRLVQTSIDLSIPLRQGVSVMFNPRTTVIGVDAYRKMISSVFNPEGKGLSKLKFDDTFYKRMMHDIKENPFYLESKDDGIVYSEVSSANPQLRDESHPHESFVYKIPFLGAPFRASERAAAAWTNYARFELYQRGVKNLLSQGKTRENSKQAYEDMAARVMVDTGRGKIPGIEDKSPSKTDTFIKGALGNVFYGARLYSSTFRKLNPLYYLNPKVDPTVRVQALKDMVGFTGGVIALGLIAKSLGASISFDYDDPDFLKARFGKKVVDITAGMSVYIRTFLRVMKAALNQVDPTVSHGDAVKYSKFAETSVKNFWRNKLAPNTAYFVNAWMGENTLGQKFDPYEIIKIYPMYTDDLKKALSEGSPLDAAMILPIGVLGLGYQEYSRDVRRARAINYVDNTDSKTRSFLKRHQLNITSDINQEVYNLDKGMPVKMTKEQSDRYESIWGKEVVNSIKSDMKELDKLPEKEFNKEISKIKREANTVAKNAISGFDVQLINLEMDDKQYVLDKDQIKKVVELGKEWEEENPTALQDMIDNEIEDGVPKEEAKVIAERAYRTKLRRISRNRFKSYVKENEIKLTEKQ